MCGILGVVKRNEKINIDGFKHLNETLNHRGPDSSGTWFSQNKKIALGHKRLSIIDSNQGSQPMFNKNRKLVISYNGEIYNFLELKKELIKKKYQFKTNSDTEVILASYEEWGTDCVNKFRGMFAFSIVDLSRKEIFLARDFMGVKPLVYYCDKNIFCFSSEINSLSRIRNLDLKIDYCSIDYYLWLQYIPAPKTIYRKMKKLEPACFMRIKFTGEIIEKKKYWRPVFKPENNRPMNVWLDEFEKVIRESVKIHTISDVPVGAFLSGGVDSTLITKYLSKTNSNLKTFSVGFKEKEYNELKYSSIVAEKFCSKYYSKIVTADFFSILNKIVRNFGEPFGDSSAIPTYFVSRLAAKHVKVVLSGDGGDELFGGYNSYIAWQDKVNKKNNRSILMNITRFILSLVRPRQYIPERPTLESWLSVVEYYNYYQRKYLWKDDYKKYLNKEYKFFNDYKIDFKNNTLVHKAQFFDLLNYLPFDILRKVDITSMMNGLEVRVPFLDKKVVEFALTIPEEINIESSEWIGKRLLKESLKNDFDKRFIYRQKKGFAVPLDKWFGEQGELYPEPFKRLINSESKIFKEIFNLDAVYNFISSGDYNKMYFILFLEEWLRQYENRKDLIKI